MKKIIIAALGLILAASFTVVKSAKIGVEKGELIINKKSFGASWMLDDFERCLGEAQKKKDGYNRTHTYDVLGIILFEKKKDTVFTGKISEVQIYFDTALEKNERTPDNAYKGTVQIENLQAHRKLPISELKEKLQGWNETESFSPHNYRMVKGGMYIYFKFNEEETELQKMSIGYALY